jgi:hypothetical protein
MTYYFYFNIKCNINAKRQKIAFYSFINEIQARYLEDKCNVGKNVPT